MIEDELYDLLLASLPTRTDRDILKDCLSMLMEHIYKVGYKSHHQCALTQHRPVITPPHIK
eukprot:scaffold1187_cov181-Ochromonas_danica.AAC.6